jgi:hypothetical protein
VSSYEPNFLDIRLESRLLSVEGVYIRMKGVVWGIWVPLGSFVDVQSARHPLHQWVGLGRLCDLTHDWAMIQVWAEFCAALEECASGISTASQRHENVMLDS